MSSWPTLHPRLANASVLDELREVWQRERKLRIEEAFAPGLAEEAARTALADSFEFYQMQQGTRFVYWRQRHAFPSASGASIPILQRIEQLVMNDIPGLVSAITERPHHAPNLPDIQFNLLRKGSYLDAHSDHLPNRLVGYVVGLTREQWPPERGGHLQFLQPDQRTPTQSWAPGFDSLDLLNFFPVMTWHHIPVMQDAHNRLTLNGWLSGMSDQAPGGYV